MHKAGDSHQHLLEVNGASLLDVATESPQSCWLELRLVPVSGCHVTTSDQEEVAALTERER